MTANQPVNSLTVSFDLDGDLRRVRLTNPEARNVLTPALVQELIGQVDEAVAAGNRALLLTATGEHFCSGMDLGAAAQDPGVTDGALFWDLLTRLREAPLLTVAVVDGVATGGGVGLVAACDVVLATSQSSFALSEALWGLLPCCVLPFLKERVGPVVARRMMLTTSQLSAEAALRTGLVDEVCDPPERVARQLILRARRVAPETFAAAVKFCAQLPEDRVNSRDIAIDTLAQVASSPLVQETLTRFNRTGTYPWEGR